MLARQSFVRLLAAWESRFCLLAESLKIMSIHWFKKVATSRRTPPLRPWYDASGVGL
jgi:hypothetical protein